MTRLAHSLTVFAMASAAVACADSVSHTSSDAHDLDEAQNATLVAFGRPVNSPPASLDGSHDFRDRFSQLRTSVLEILTSDKSLDERDQSIRSFLVANRGFRLSYYVEQFAAVHMLTEMLASEDEGLEEDIGHYASLLVQNGSPEAPVLHEAFRRLRDTWPPERLAHAARLTAERALEWTERVCASCGTPKAAGDMPDYEDRRLEIKSRDLAEAARRLTLMAGP